jgi:hypothetical protein
MNLGFYSNTQNFWVDFTSRVTFPPAPQFSTRQPIIRGDQEGLFKLVTLDRILNHITGVTSG